MTKGFALYIIYIVHNIVNKWKKISEKISRFQKFYESPAVIAGTLTTGTSDALLPVSLQVTWTQNDSVHTGVINLLHNSLAKLNRFLMMLIKPIDKL